jgi:PAS domain S-box-containing protein
MSDSRYDIDNADNIYRTMFDLMNEMMLVSYVDGTIININKEFTNNLGYTTEDVIGHNYMDFIHPDDLERTVKKHMSMTSAISSHKLVGYENTFMHKDGKYLRIVWNAIVIEDKYFAIGRKVDTIDEYLSKITHELRNPLNAIIGFTQLLKLEPLTGDVADYVGHIDKSSRSLLEMINNIMDLDKVSFTNIILENVMLDHVIMQACNESIPHLKCRGVQIRYHREKCDYYVLVQHVKLLQIFRNLIDNGIKYNKTHGALNIYAYTDMANGLSGSVTVVLADTGVGIAETDLERIFLPFQRCVGDKVYIEGSGIGLSIVKKSIEMFGGSISCTSRLGIGSEFRVKFPISKLPGDRISGVKYFNPRTENTLLYIENDPVHVKLLERTIQSFKGLKFLSANTGQEGLRVARSERPNIIFMDFHLIDMNAGEVYLKLREDIVDYHIDFICVLSADSSHQRIRQMQELGISNYIVKPIEVEEIKDIVSNILNQVIDGHALLC